MELKAYAELEELLRPLWEQPWLPEPNLRLERIEALLTALGDPHRRYPTVHVGGTSGKGSVATLTAAVLTAHGRRTGLHVSPFVHVLTETWQLDGAYARPSTVLPVLRETLEAAESLGATYFEAKVAAAFLLFAREEVDVAVIEVGLGGARDATNVLGPGVQVLTNVGLDHTGILGDTVEEIARDKVEIFKPESLIVSGVTQPSVIEIVRARAAAVRSELRAVSVGNEGLAVAAAEARIGALDSGLVARALGAVSLPARLELLADQGRPVLLDGAHNAEKIARTVGCVDREISARPRIGVVALKADKDVAAVLGPLASVLDAVVFTAFATGPFEATPPAELAAGFAGRAEVEPDPQRAVDRALELAGPGGALVVTGSLYLAGNVRGRWVDTTGEILAGASYRL